MRGRPATKIAIIRLSLPSEILLVMPVPAVAIWRAVMSTDAFVRDLAWRDWTAGFLRARRAWAQAAGLAIQNSGLSVSLATVVLLVARHPEGIQQGTLAEEVGVNPGAMVRTLDQAEAAQLVERR